MITDNTEMLNKTLSKLTQQLKEKDAKINQLLAEIQTTKGVKVKRFDQIPTDDCSKQIVKLYAQGYSSGFIHEILNKELNLTVDIERIDSIIRDITGDKLKTDNQLLSYYIECKKLFEDENTLSKGFYAQTLYKKYRYLEQSYSKCWKQADEAGDYKESRMALDSMEKLIKDEAQLFSKNVLNIFTNNNKAIEEEDQEYADAKDKILNGNKKIISFRKES